MAFSDNCRIHQNYLLALNVLSLFIIDAGKILGREIPAFYELMTAPMNKV